jgi:hypothetical protein
VVLATLAAALAAGAPDARGRLGLVAFLAWPVTRSAAFADTAKANLRERLKNYATAYAAGIDFTRDRSLYIREQPPDSRFDVPAVACTCRW